MVFRRFVEGLRQRGNLPALLWKEGKETQKYTYGKVASLAHAYAQGFLDEGLEKGDRVAIISSRNPRTVPAAIGANLAGLVVVPRGEDMPTEDIRHVIENSDASAAIVQNSQIYTGGIEKVFSLEQDDVIPHLDTLAREGNAPLPHVHLRNASSILYTTGTTGKAKGVVHSYRAFAENVKAVMERVTFNEGDEIITILPLGHALGFASEVFGFCQGVQIIHTDISNFAETLRAHNPRGVVGPPEFWKMVMKRTDLRTGRLFSRKTLIRKGFGKKFEYAISSGGVMHPKTLDFLHECGLNSIDVYGSTEILCVAVNGKPLRGVDVRVTGEQGEIQVRSPSAMLGYFRDLDSTQRAFENEWYNTGDLGNVSEQGELEILCRGDDMLALSTGENVSAVKLEQMLEENDLVDRAIVVGDGCRRGGVLIVPNQRALRKRIRRIENPEQFRQLYLQVLEETFTDQLPQYERLRRFAILPEIDPSCLTIQGKVKRREVKERYAEQMAGMELS